MVPLFAFLGDTVPQVFDLNPELFTFPYVITECSFLNGDQTDSKGHTHWSGLKPLVEVHPECTFILIHWSLSHKSQEIREFFDKLGLPNVIPFGVQDNEEKIVA